MKTKLLSVTLLSLLSLNVMAASVEEVRAVLETEVTHIEEEKNVLRVITTLRAYSMMMGQRLLLDFVLAALRKLHFP